jgi:hypothetical protein
VYPEVAIRALKSSINAEGQAITDSGVKELIYSALTWCNKDFSQVEDVVEDAQFLLTDCARELQRLSASDAALQEARSSESTATNAPETGQSGTPAAAALGETPETDAACGKIRNIVQTVKGHHEIVPADFSRRLERERDALRRKAAAWTKNTEAAPKEEAVKWANEILVHAADYGAPSIECALEILRIAEKLKGTP